MVNLLPPTAKRQVVIEYYIRTVSVWLFLVTGAMLTLGLLLLPVGVLVDVQLKAYDETFTRVSADNASFADSEKVVRKANELADELYRLDAFVPLWNDVALLQSLAETTISIDSISLERASSTGAVAAIMVTGEATTRAALAAFRDRIEASPRFTSAALPISNLAKDREVPFSIAVTVNTETP